MPIVGGGSADNKIQIEIQALDNVSAKLTTIEKNLDGMTRRRIANDKAMAAASAKASKSQEEMWKNINKGVATGVLLVATAFKKSWDEYMKYADSVRQLSQLSGATAEDSSRLIQVLDDYGISAEQATLATKALTKEGLTPSIETLAKLSDQYLSLGTVQEKNEFLLKKLGKGGLDYTDVLNKGSAALLKQGAAVSENLILTQKQIDQQKLVKIGIDALMDDVKGYTYQIMPAFNEGLLSVVTTMRDWTGTARILGEQGLELEDITLNNVAAAFGLAVAQREEADSALMAADAANEHEKSLLDQKEAIEAAKDALKDYEKQLEAVSQANKDMESMSRTIAQDQVKYTEDHNSAVQEKIDKEREYADAIREYGKQSEEALTALGDVDIAQEGIDKLQATWHEAAQNMIYDMILVGVSAGGLLDSEQQALDEYAVKAGIKTQADIDEANRRRDVADATIAGILQSENVLNEQRRIDAETLRLTEAQASTEKLNAAGNEVAAIGQVSEMTQAEIHNQMLLAQAARATASAYKGIGYGGGKSVTPPSAGGGKGTIGPIGRQDSGGAGVAGTPYMIGTGAQPEMFIPSTNGTFVPNADKKGFGGSNVYNINIQNPKAVTAEGSIRKALKMTSYLGAPA